MSKSWRFADLYGYAMCLITVVIMIIAIAGLIDAAMDYRDPLHSQPWRRSSDRSLASFEIYKLDVMRSLDTDAGGAAWVPNEAEIQGMYEAELADAIGKARSSASKRLVINVVLILISAALFTVHWRWVRRLSGAGEEAAPAC
jgi:hypothetical protein